MKQKKQREWLDQWNLLEDNELFLFKDWIYPNTLEDFKGKSVLECGCGGGQHTSFIAPYAKAITAIDLNAVSVAKARNAAYSNITYIEDDIAEMHLERQFDIVFSIGVVHHTDSPDKTVANLIRHVKPGGRIILWVYSKEGNWLAEHGVEFFRNKFLKKRTTGQILVLSKVITAAMYLPIYTLYRLPFPALPYYRYFVNFRKMSFMRNCLNVLDKLNAPQVQFIDKPRIKKWLPETEFHDIHLNAYAGVSWRLSGQRKLDA